MSKADFQATDSNETASQPAHVLVVDDELANRELLNDLLEVQGYRVTLAEDGAEALAKMPADPPDAVLLDVMMPKLNGYEVCKAVRADEALAHIPILLVTALNDRRDRIQGIQAGANEFLTKPLDAQEVMLRVRNAVSSKRLFDQVQNQCTRLNDLEQMRDNLVQMIVHDLRGPLSGIYGYMQLLQLKSGGMEEDVREYIDHGLRLSSAMEGMIANMLDVSRMESDEMPLKLRQTELMEVIGAGIGRLGAQSGRIDYRPAAPVGVQCDADIIGRVVGNLVSNALNYSGEEEVVRVEVEGDGDWVRVRVIDCGPGIPQKYHEHIFEKFGQVKVREDRRKYSSGLGLCFCKMAVEAHRGRIGLESVEGQGSTFWFDLPVAKAAAGAGDQGLHTQLAVARDVLRYGEGVGAS